MKNKRKISLLLAVLMIVGIVFTFAWADTPNKFTDVKKGDWFYDAVQYCVEHGLVYGRTSNTFVPQGNVTRAEFVAILARIHGVNTSEYSNSKFYDVNSGDWFFGAVNWATEFGVANGVSSTSFNPNDPVTREQVAAFVHRYIKLCNMETDLNTTSNEPWQFADAAYVSSWAKDSVRAMHASGLMIGDQSRMFNPFKNMSRAEAATLLSRLYNAIADSTSTPMQYHEHEWSDWKVKIAATCTKDGLESRNCTGCDEVEERVIPKTGHTWSGWVVTEPTCVTDGVKTRTCASCGEVESVVIPKIGHTWSEWDVASPTCETDGVKSHVCATCNAVETVTIPATGHNWDDGTVTKQYTCTEDGEITYTCKNDSNHTKTEVVPAHHNFGESVVVKEPTCEETGLEEGVCAVCGEKRTNEIPALGHDLKLVKGTEPTCEETGTKDTWRCSVCGKTFLDKEGTTVVNASNAVIPALGHDWQKAYETKTFTLYKMEQHEFCDICHKDLTEMDYLAAHEHLAGHDSNDSNYMKSHMEYVSTENGEMATTKLVGYKCSRCGNTKDAAPAGEHVHDYQPIMFKAELPAFKSVTIQRCSACDMDCTNMTEEEWQDHFDSHMMKKDGEFAIRYNSVETVLDGTRKFDVQIGWKCTSNDSIVYFSMYAPQYDFSKDASKTAILRGHECNEESCHALFAVGGYVNDSTREEIGPFVTSQSVRTDHQYAHALAGEGSGYHSISNMKAVIEYVHHRNFTGFVEL